MRIGMFTDPELVNSAYRSFHPLDAVARRGHTLLPNFGGRPTTRKELLSCDAMLMHRASTTEACELVRFLQNAGVGVVWDNDDDVAALPRSNPYYARLGAAGRRAMIAGTAEMVRMADVVTTPSAVLAAKFAELGARDVRVLENRLPRPFLGVKPIAHEGVVVACLAGLEHRVDYDGLGLRDALTRLLEQHADLRVLTIGHGLGLPPDRTEHLTIVEFPALVRTLARADVGIAPLIDIAWNRARSNVKLKEYAAAGLAWLASPVGPYVGMGERQGGCLVPDDGWDVALERIVSDARARRKLAKRGAKWVKGECVEDHAADWEAALRTAAERGRARQSSALARSA